MEPRLTPSHNLEEESLFGTWTTFRRWSGILSKSLQERESHAPLRIHSGYSLAFFFLFFCHPEEQHMRAACWIQGSRYEPIWQLESMLAEPCAASATQHALKYFCGATGCDHSSQRLIWVVGQIYTCGITERVTELEEKMAKTVVWLGKSARKQKVQFVLSYEPSVPCQWRMQWVKNEQPICLEVKTLDGKLLPSNGQVRELHPLFHRAMSPHEQSIKSSNFTS